MGQGLSLRARLGLSVALVVAAVVGATTFVVNRVVARTVEQEAQEAAAATALGVAGELGERGSFPSDADLDALLSQFARAEPALQSLTVTRDGSDVAVLTTDESPSPLALALARQAVREGRLVAAGGPALSHSVGIPLTRDGRTEGAVVVTVSLEAARRVRGQVEHAALLLGAVATVVLIGSLDLVARRLVLDPLEGIRSVMSRAAAGDLAARVAGVRSDEIGAVGRGLDAMLDRLANFGAALRKEVDRATTELQAANRQLEEAAQRLFAARRDLARSEQLASAGRMAAEVAHQIGTPLNLVSGYVQMLLAEKEEGSREAVKLCTVRDQIARVTGIVQGLLDEARRPVLRLGPASPARIVEGVAELVRPAVHAAAVELSVDVAPGLPAVLVDAGQIEQALLNLVTNSLDAMPKGGRLRLEACVRGDMVELVVGDSGQGIAPEILDRVFDPLFTTKPPGRGTGLGLSIVRDVVAAHGGTVDFARGAASGTTVVVRLPVPPPGGDRG